MDIWGSVAATISDATHRPFVLHDAAPVSGGSINQAYRLHGKDGSHYFLKLNDARHHPNFIAEVAGLAALGTYATLRVPHVITHGVTGRQSYLVLEHLELHTHGDARLLGERLAGLHRCTSDRFGFARDNFIGTTAQANTWTNDWVDFWRVHRLGFQLRLAAQIGHGATLQRLGEHVLDMLPEFFSGHTPQPSLLHGDLWGGNHAYLSDGTPVIFDPACYYGDRECDVAMTELFGGYAPDFYSAYRAAWPLDAGYETRRELYNLYHILNHANLFGAGYVRQAEQTMRKLLD